MCGARRGEPQRQTAAALRLRSGQASRRTPHGGQVPPMSPVGQHPREGMRGSEGRSKQRPYRRTCGRPWLWHEMVSSGQWRVTGKTKDRSGGEHASSPLRADEGLGSTDESPGSMNSNRGFCFVRGGTSGNATLPARGGVAVPFGASGCRSRTGRRVGLRCLLPARLAARWDRGREPGESSGRSAWFRPGW